VVQKDGEERRMRMRREDQEKRVKYLFEMFVFKRKGCNPKLACYFTECPLS